MNGPQLFVPDYASAKAVRLTQGLTLVSLSPHLNTATFVSLTDADDRPVALLSGATGVALADVFRPLEVIREQLPPLVAADEIVLDEVAGRVELGAELFKCKADGVVVYPAGGGVARYLAYRELLRGIPADQYQPVLQALPGPIRPRSYPRYQCSACRPRRRVLAPPGGEVPVCPAHGAMQPVP